LAHPAKKGLRSPILCLIFLVYLSLTILSYIIIRFNISIFVFSLLCRFTDDTFNDDNAVTIGVDFKMRKITVDNNNIKLALWVNN